MKTLMFQVFWWFKENMDTMSQKRGKKVENNKEMETWGSSSPLGRSPLRHTWLFFYWAEPWKKGSNCRKRGEIGTSPSILAEKYLITQWTKARWCWKLYQKAVDYTNWWIFESIDNSPPKVAEWSAATQIWKL